MPCPPTRPSEPTERPRRGAGASVPPDAPARLSVAVARLDEGAAEIAARVVARARAARRIGATAAGYRVHARTLERAAARAGGLLFGRAAETARASAAESRFVADALDAMAGTPPGTG